MWGRNMGHGGGLGEIDRVQGSFCKKVLRIPRCVMNGIAELELGRESRRGKIK
jgi:hypothetical protein